VYRDEQLKPADEIAKCSYDSGSPTSVSKQRKITESIMPVLAAPPAYASYPAAAGSCKQEGIGTEVVSSDMDLGCFDVDPSAFMDICRTISGCESSLEFQKCLSEYERDSCDLNFTSGELTCLSVSDVNDAVAEKLPAAQQSSVDSGSSVQNATFASQAFQPLHGEMKYVNPPFSVPTVPVDNYSVQPWHQSSQLQEPVMQHLQLLLASLPTQQPDSAELLKYYQMMQMKHRPSLKMQLQSYDNQNPSRTQGIPQPQQPQRNELQSYYPADVSAQHVQPYVMAEEQQTWSHPEWQMSAHCTQQPAQHQLYPCQFVPASVGAYDHSVKKEMPLSVIVSSATHTTARPHQQMLSVCSENNGQALPSQYSNATLVTPTCQSQSTINWQMNW